MISPLFFSSLAIPFLASQTWAQSFTIANGQIYTPGLVILNAPQPGTPLGGENLHVSIDVTANGRLNLPPYVNESPTQIHNITMFLYSYDTGRNFTISNGTATVNNASLGVIMAQEPGSTVKHVNWLWPSCLVGDGQPRDAGSDRGVYNISIRQNFRLNGQDHYTIFDVPIAVTNRIDQDFNRPSCDSLSNPMMAPSEINAASANSVGILFAPGDATQVRFISDSNKDSGNGLGPPRSAATGAQGLGGAGGLSWRNGALWICGISTGLAFIL